MDMIGVRGPGNSFFLTSLNLIMIYNIDIIDRGEG